MKKASPFKVLIAGAMDTELHPLFKIIGKPKPLPTWTPVPTKTLTLTNAPTTTITLTHTPTKIVKQTKNNDNKQILKKKTFWQWLFGN